MMRLKYRTWLLVGAILATIAITLIYTWLFHDLPAINQINEQRPIPSVQITDRRGRLLYESLDTDWGRQHFVSLETIPNDLLLATIATEDRNFYENPGVDMVGIVRSVWINLQGGETIAGGSTITQQVARNLLLDTDERYERTVRRKLRETALAWQLTQRFSKDEVLELYLNNMYYGGLSYGVDGAARTYFGKPVSDLGLAECALIAGLPQAPAIYNPFSNPEAAQERQMIVLGLMEKHGFISSKTRQLAEREQLQYSTAPFPSEALHFVLMVRSEMDALITPEVLATSGGIIVQTTLDLDWQKKAEKSIFYQMKFLEEGPNQFDHNLNSMALTALDPENGEILALVGSPDYFDVEHGGAINMALSPRQPGSALKPIVYAAAFDPTSAAPWTAATMILDVQTSFITHDGEAYIPANFDSLEHGPVLVRNALGSSLNIPAVITLDQIGLESLFNLTNRLGLDSIGQPEDHDLSLALGGGEVSLLDLTAAYGALANGGYRIEPFSIQKITNSHGENIYEGRSAQAERVLDERVAWLISDILGDDTARVLGFGPHSVLELDRPAAVKTGTTTSFHDNWTVGYTPDLVVGVWAGNTNYEPMREITGLTGAAPVWHQFVRAVLDEQPERDFVRPDGLTQVEICSLSGLLPTEDCQNRRLEWFIEGTEPGDVDYLHYTVEVDVRTSTLAGESTPDEWRALWVVLDLPPEARAWARRSGLVLLSDLIAPGEGAVGGSGTDEDTIRLHSPAANAVYFLSDSIPRDSQKIEIEALGESTFTEVSLWVDGYQYAVFTELPYRVLWQLEAGGHKFWAEAQGADGARVVSSTIEIEVRTKE
jgi:penicillin-binding protein 1C